MPKVYDCCMFYNELDMLEARMHILGDVVDHFVVCEAGETHSGKPKPYYFEQHIDRFLPWADRIIYVQVPDLTGPGRNSWQRETYHRSQIAAGLVDAQADDWVIVGDCDEIANPAVVAGLRDFPVECSAAQLELDFYYYNVNRRVREGWSIGAYRWGAEQDPNRIRTCASGQSLRMLNAGWHFSWFGGVAQIIAKHTAFMHFDDPIIRDLPHDPAYVDVKIKTGSDLFDRPGFVIERVPLSPTLPTYILDNIEKYQAMGWVAE
jgi:hypothetical protein